MPRGGWGASRFSRRFDTDALEYLDRDDVPAAWRAQVMRALDRGHRVSGTYQRLCHRALALTDAAEPRFVELGAGHGELSRRLLRASPTARVTVSDLGEDFVAAMEGSDLAHHPRADIRRIDATSIDADDNTWDVAIFAFALHHLPPTLVVDLLRETTRVARVLLVVDPVRNPLLYAVLPPFVIPSQPPVLHDGIISARRAYSRSALQAIGDAAGVNVRTTFMPPAFTVLVARRS